MNETKKYIVFFFLLIIILSCSKKQMPLSDSVQFQMEDDKNYILFVNYILTNEKGVLKATFINQIVREGKLKPFQNENNLSGTLAFEQLNGNDELLDQLVLQNPLIKTYEFVDDNGQLNKKEVVLDSAEFSLRTQIIPSARKFILCYQKNNGEKLILHVLDL